MVSTDAHIKQWLHNRAHLASITSAYPDWMVTASFYCALHAVDSLLCHDNVKNIISHKTRNDVLIRTNRYDAIRRAYLPLYDLSRTVRYLAEPEKWVPLERIQKDVIARYLYPI